MKISNLEVTFSRMVQPAQYESKSASATIGYSADEGEEVDAGAALEAAFKLAASKVLAAVGLKKPEPVAATATIAPTADALKQAYAAKAEEEAKPKKRGRKSKAQKDAEAAAAQETPAPASAADVTDVSPSPSQASAADIVEEDIPDFLKAAPAISDGDMNKACAMKMKELKGAGVVDASTRIRGLIEKYVDGVATLTNIPQEKRQAFLDTLATVKA